jgi:predicted RNase H-like nuclease (RuvC/YqgF family)
MKAIDRRLRRLEERLAPQENEEVGRLVELLRERRRRRAEASGEPFEVRSCEALTLDQNRPLSVADILRCGRRRVAAANERPPG